MENNILYNNIETIKMPAPIINLLKKNDILLIKDLCSKSKTDLKNMCLSFSEINKIQVEVQLLGLNLRKCE